MAQYQNLRGLCKNLPAQSVDGAIYWTLDGTILMGIEGGAYKEYGSVTTVASTSDLPESASPAMLFYVESENVLAKYDEETSAYVQINKDSNTTYEFAKGDNEGELKVVAKDKAGNTVGEPVVVSVVDVNAINTAIAEAKGIAEQGVADAATAQAAAEAAQKTADDLADFVGDIPENYTEQTVIAYINKKAEETLNAASGGSSESAASVLAALNTYKSENDPKVQANTDDITALKEKVGDTAVGTQIDEKVAEESERAVAREDEIAQSVVTESERAIAKENEIAASVTAEKERAELAEQANAQAAADAMTEAQAKVASVTAGDASVTVAGTSTAPTVAVKLDPSADNAIKLGENGLKVEISAAPEYSIVKTADSGEFAAVYNLTKDGAIVGASINIPKDLVVKSGSVVDGDIVLVLNDEANTEIVIPADSLIEYVTSGSATGDMVVINVSDDHKVTASITDGSITLAKLTTEVQTAIGQAHTHENADVLAGINADKVAAWDSAEADAIAEAGRLDAALKSELQTEIGNVDAKFADYKTATEVEADIKAEADRAKEAEAGLAEAKADKATTLAGYGITDAMTADEITQAIEASEYDDTEIAGKVSTLESEMDAVESDVATLKAIDHNAYVAADEKVVEDMQAYADQAEADAVATANAFTTEALTWGEF